MDSPSQAQKSVNLRESVSYKRLLSSPLASQDRGFWKFQQLCSDALKIGVDTEQKGLLQEHKVGPEQVLLIQKVLDDQFREYPDLKPVSIFKTLKFDQEGNSDLYRLKKWCQQYLTFDAEVEAALTSHKLALHSLMSQNDADKHKLRSLELQLSSGKKSDNATDQARPGRFEEKPPSLTTKPGQISDYYNPGINNLHKKNPPVMNQQGLQTQYQQD